MTDNNTALKKAGLKVTLPRLKILEVLQEPDNHHVSAEDLYKRLIDMGEEIGLAQMYRAYGVQDTNAIGQGISRILSCNTAAAMCGVLEEIGTALQGAPEPQAADSSEIGRAACRERG